MNSLLSMEWNAKTPFQWDLESQVMFNSKTTEIPRKLQSPDWGIGVGEIDFGSPISSGGAGSGSKSASVNSSLVGEMKTHKFPEDFGSKKESANAWPTGTSPMLDASVGSAEPILDLKLGKWTYLEDVCAGRNANASSCSVIPVSSTTPAKRSKSNSQDAHAPRCQVEGCNLNLSSAKDYHRKHRVCESHSKCPRVIVGGLEHRFCQQCSRFHGLSEFDAKKRSCRKRLSDHNARRRKPQPEPVRVSQAGLSSSPYDARHQMSLVWNRFPLLHARPAPNLTWESACGSKFKQTKECMFNPAKGGNEEQLRLPHNKFPNGITTLFHDSDRLLPSKGTAAEILNQGLEESIISSNLDTSQDLHSALSLLSTNSWGSSEAKPSQLDHPTMHTIHIGMPQPVLYAMPQGVPLASAEYWETERHPNNNSEMHTFTSRGNGSNQFQEFQLFREPFESGFHSNQLN